VCSSPHTSVALCEGYGLTEATCATARSFPGARRAGSVGQRMPYQQVKAVAIDPDNGSRTDVETGRTGVITISGPTVFPGYIVTTEQGPRPYSSGKVVDGWLDTGDIGRVDPDGFLYLTGRAKDLIIRGGHNIDPAVIEDALLAHPAVTAASAVGRPDPHAGEVPVAYVALAPGAAATPEELRVWPNATSPKVPPRPNRWWCAIRCPSPTSASPTNPNSVAMPPNVLSATNSSRSDCIPLQYHRGLSWPTALSE
jgi:fatty-acyl-CoA synthase